MGAPSAVASVFVPTALNIAPGPGGLAAQPFAAQMNEPLRAARRGLEESFASYAVAAGNTATIDRRQVAGAFSV